MALLNEEQIAQAKERAEQVVNGFTKVRDQQARDAVNLAETLQLRNKQIAALMAELEKRGVFNKASFGGSNCFASMFNDVFGNDFFGAGSPFGAGSAFGKGSGKKK